MLEKVPLGNGLVRVTFRVSNQVWADHIALVGEFNDWRLYHHLLQQTYGDSDWHITLDLEAGRSYRFRYLVDGSEWMADNRADGHVFNSHGGVDCVVVT